MDVCKVKEIDHELDETIKILQRQDSDAIARRLFYVLVAACCTFLHARLIASPFHLYFCICVCVKLHHTFLSYLYLNHLYCLHNTYVYHCIKARRGYSSKNQSGYTD